MTYRRIVLTGILVLVLICCFGRCGSVNARVLQDDEIMQAAGTNKTELNTANTNQEVIPIGGDDVSVNGGALNSQDKLSVIENAAATAGGLISSGKTKQEVVTALTDMGYTPLESEIAYIKAGTGQTQQPPVVSDTEADAGTETLPVGIAVPVAMEVDSGSSNTVASLLTVGGLFDSVSSFFSNDKAVGVGVHVELNSNDEVQSIKVGGTSLSKDKILTFDSNKDGIVTKTEFEANKDTFNYPKPQAVKVALGDGWTKDQADQMIAWIGEAQDFMNSLGFECSTPSTLEFFDDGLGGYGSKDTWHFSSFDGGKGGAYGEAVMRALGDKYANLGYTGTEAFGKYFTSSMGLDNSTEKTHTYDPSLEGLTGNDIKNNYSQEMLDKVTNNSKALFEAMWEIDGAMADKDASKNLVKGALEALSGSVDPKGIDILNAFLKADEKLNGGANSALIQEKFGAHGVTAANTNGSDTTVNRSTSAGAEAITQTTATTAGEQQTTLKPAAKKVAETVPSQTKSAANVSTETTDNGTSMRNPDINIMPAGPTEDNGTSMRNPDINIMPAGTETGKSGPYTFVPDAGGLYTFVPDTVADVAAPGTPKLGHYNMNEVTVDVGGDGGISKKTSILWNDKYSFKDRLNCFRNCSTSDHAVKFSDLTAEDRQTVFSNLSQDEKKALYQALPANLQQEVVGLLDTACTNLQPITPYTGTVFAINPLDGSTVQVNYSSLWGDGQLNGSSCQITYKDGSPVVTTSDNNFNFRLGDVSFLAANLYYQADSTQQYFSELGQGTLSVKFVLHDGVVDGFVGGINVYRENLSKAQTEGTCIMPFAHEYMHRVTADQTEGKNLDNQNLSVSAEIVDEALATYFPSSMTGESKFNEWGRRNEPNRIIDISSTLIYDADDNSLNNGGVHNRDGVGSGICAMSSALWSLRTSLGDETADKVIFNSIKDMDFTAGENKSSRSESDTAVFTSFAQALIKSDAQTTGGSNKALIIDTLKNHGFQLNL